jgi:cyclophilin family peptidyl-prolyl cis-trans isomerase
MAADKIESERKRSRPLTKRSFKKNKLALGVALVIVFIIIISGIYIAFFYNKEGSSNNSSTNPIAIINTSMGTIKVELFKDKVPNTVNNFINLVNINFYDGLVFHRVIDNFMIQGGGFYPNGTQKQSPFGPIDLEINEDVHHVDGAIAMARTPDPNSATSQFFIDDGPQPSLEPGGVDAYGYAAFGVVIEGMDVVRAIASLDPENTTTKFGSNQNWPINDVFISSITIEYV